MAKEAKEAQVKGRPMQVVDGKAFPRRNHAWHLDRDPNDPRRVPAAETGFSLNEDDPEKAPAPQNPIE